jgi:hypothetical protein
MPSADPGPGSCGNNRFCLLLEVDADAAAAMSSMDTHTHAIADRNNTKMMDGTDEEDLCLTRFPSPENERIIFSSLWCCFDLHMECNAVLSHSLPS